MFSKTNHHDRDSVVFLNEKTANPFSQDPVSLKKSGRDKKDQDILAYALDNYIAEDGLMRLNKTDSRLGYNGYQLETVHNDNGVLFLAHFVSLLPKTQALLLKTMVAKLLKSLEWGEKGVFTVNPRRFNNNNSHDNYIAISYLSLYYDLSFGLEMSARGSEDGFTFQNYLQTRYVYIQPKDRAFIKICAGIRPSLFEYINLFGSFIFNIFQDKRNTSSTLLAWIRNAGCDLAFERHNDKPVLQKMLRWLEVVRVYWLSKKDVKFAFNFYFKDENHPIRLLATKEDRYVV